MRAPSLTAPGSFSQVIGDYAVHAATHDLLAKFLSARLTTFELLDAFFSSVRSLVDMNFAALLTVNIDDGYWMIIQN